MYISRVQSHFGYGHPGCLLYLERAIFILMYLAISGSCRKIASDFSDGDPCIHVWVFLGTGFNYTGLMSRPRVRLDDVSIFNDLIF